MSSALPTAPQIANTFTVDVEDYFHPNAMDAATSPQAWDHLPSRVEANTLRLLDLLDEFEVRATFFVLGWVAERWPQLPAEIARRGHEVASHGHAHRLVYTQQPRQFRDDLRRSKAVLEDCLGTPIAGFRAASYSVVQSTLWALDILIEEGFAYDSSIFPTRHDIYGIPDFPRFAVTVLRPAGSIIELPPSTLRFLGNNWPVAGGGYLRLLPYALTARALRHLNLREAAPAMVYVHPWEIDSQQPRLNAGIKARFRQYTNLRRTEGRLRRLLGEFRFVPIREAIGGAPLPCLELLDASSPSLAGAIHRLSQQESCHRHAGERQHNANPR